MLDSLANGIFQVVMRHAQLTHSESQVWFLLPSPLFHSLLCTHRDSFNEYPRAEEWVLSLQVQVHLCRSRFSIISNFFRDGASYGASSSQILRASGVFLQLKGCIHIYITAVSCPTNDLPV